jgi:hypothetical protein
MIDKKTVAIAEDWIARRRGDIQVDQPEVAVLSEEEKVFESSLELRNNNSVNKRNHAP